MAYNIQLDTAQNQIRLLHLSPATYEHDEIFCNFSLVSIDQGVPYEALSYAWGDTDERVSINVKGNPFLITPNLHTALVHLRYPDQERILWIDALCINQADQHERTHQVSHMKAIYEQASRVVVWLGEAWDGSDLAMDFLEVLGNGRRLHLFPSVGPFVAVGNQTLESDEMTENLIRLFNLSWWTRTWTVQEFILAKKLIFQCGTRILAQHLMLKAGAHFWIHYRRCCPGKQLDSNHPLLGISLEQSFRTLNRLKFATEQIHQSSLLYTISDFSGQRTTDSRDKIYGMLGLGFGPYLDIIEPDYTIAPGQICENFALKCVERTGKLEIFSHLFGGVDPTLPSFVPRWTGDFTWSINYPARLDVLGHYNAGLGTSARVELVAPGMIAVKGKIVDVVKNRMDNSWYHLPPDQYLKELRALSELNVDRDDERSRELAWIRTLCGDVEQFSDGSNIMIRRVSDPSHLRNSFLKWSAWFVASASEPHDELLDSGVTNFDQIFASVTEGRRFIRTQTGYMGFAPKSCKEGDLIVVLTGGDVPYILRPTIEQTQRPVLPRQRPDFTHAVQPKRGSTGRTKRIARFLSEFIYTKRPGSTTRSQSEPAKSNSKIRVSWSKSTPISSLRSIQGKRGSEEQLQQYIILGDCYIHGIMDGEAFEDSEEIEKELQDIVLV